MNYIHFTTLLPKFLNMFDNREHIMTRSEEKRVVTTKSKTQILTN